MSSNITLYTWPTPNGIKASITLEELGLPYKTEQIDISTNIQKEEYGCALRVRCGVAVLLTTAYQMVLED